MTTVSDMLYQFGGAPAGMNVPFSSRAKYYFVEPEYGSDSNTGLSLESPLATVTAAFAKCVANQNDTIFLIANSNTSADTTTYLSAQLEWNKDLTHLIGICSPVLVSQRARIAQLSTATGLSPMVSISANGCVFKNVSFFQGVDDATSLINVQVTGDRNYFENVHFAGGGHVSNAVDGCTSLKLRAAEENLFVNCTFGVDTVDAATGVVAILFDSESHRNEFRGCRVRIRAGNAGAAFAEITDATGIDRDTIFDNCIFLNNSATNLTSGFVIPAGMGAPRKLLLKDCMVLGTAKLDANDRGVLYGNMNAITGADASGVAVQLVT